MLAARAFATFLGLLATTFHLWAETDSSALTIVIEDYPPYEYVDQGQVTGINVDLISTILDRLGVPHEFKPETYPFPRVDMLLRKGKIDAYPSLSYQPDREDYILFSEEQKLAAMEGRIPSDHLWVTEYVFFVRRQAEDALRFESYEQMQKDGYRVGVLREYSYDKAFRDATLDRRPFSTATEALQALAEGKVDVFPMDRTIGHWLIRRAGLEGQVSALPRPLFSKAYLMAFARHSHFPDIAGIHERFYKELRAMRDSGDVEAVINRYRCRNGQRSLPRPFLFVCEEWAPYEFLDGGKPAGIDVELVDIIMRRMGIPYEIRFYPWSRAWMMVQKGRADAVLSLSYKPSRDPLLYYTQEQRRAASTGALPADHLWMSEYVFFVKKLYRNRFRFESYAQVKQDGLRVGTNKDYSYSREFMDANLSHRTYPTTTDALRALVDEEIDLYPMDRTVGLASLKQLGLAESVTTLPTPLFSKPYLAPFSRISDFPRNEHLMYEFYAELRQLRSCGKAKRIVDSYTRPSAPDTPVLP